MTSTTKAAHKIVYGSFLCWIILFLSFSVALFSCDKQKGSSEPQIYDGPSSTLQDAIIWHSDSGRMKAKVVASRILNFQNNDREVPEGLFIEFYSLEGTLEATLRSDVAYYSDEKKRWKAQGNVVIHNLVNEETLNTEELFWEPATENVSTEKFVKIERPGELVTGTGLHAKQDFSTWTIDQPEGIFEIEDNERNPKDPTKSN